MIHEDQGIPTVQEVIHARSIKHCIQLETHSNPLLHPIPRDNVIQRLRLQPATRIPPQPATPKLQHTLKQEHMTNVVI